MFFDIFFTSCLYYINLIFMSIPLVYFLDSSKKSDFLQYGIKKEGVGALLRLPPYYFSFLNSPDSPDLHRID